MNKPTLHQEPKRGSERPVTHTYPQPRKKCPLQKEPHHPLRPRDHRCPHCAAANAMQLHTLSRSTKPNRHNVPPEKRALATAAAPQPPRAGFSTCQKAQTRQAQNPSTGFLLLDGVLCWEDKNHPPYPCQAARRNKSPPAQGQPWDRQAPTPGNLAPALAARHPAAGRGCGARQGSGTGTGGAWPWGELLLA